MEKDWGVGLQEEISGNHGLDEDMIIATHRSVEVGEGLYSQFAQITKGANNCYGTKKYSACVCVWISTCPVFFVLFFCFFVFCQVALRVFSDIIVRVAFLTVGC